MQGDINDLINLFSDDMHTLCHTLFYCVYIVILGKIRVIYLSIFMRVASQAMGNNMCTRRCRMIRLVRSKFVYTLKWLVSLDIIDSLRRVKAVSMQIVLH